MSEYFHLIVASPTLAFILFVIGVLGIYREFLNPGRVIPGVFGLALIVISIYALAQNGPTAPGLALVAAGIVLFGVEARWNLRFMPGIVATLCLIDGFRRLIPGPQGIKFVFVVLGSLVLGAVTILLAYGARRARQNKWSDVSPRVEE
jgi:membrane-bound ClpP family serine protease